MTQQPFSRPGAVDLSGLNRPAAPSSGGASPATSSHGSAYSLDVSQQNLQTLLESSVTAPVVLVFYSPSRVPESTAYADEVAAAIDAYDGRFLAGLVDIDASPEIAQSLQIQQVPLLMVILDGRPAAQPIPGVLKRDEIDTLLNQLAQGLTAQGITSRHQPLTAAVPADGDEPEEQVDPRYAAAHQALENNDVDGAVTEYQRLVDANPADAEAAAGLAMAKVLQRTQGVDLDAAREAAAAEPGRRRRSDAGGRPRSARRARRRLLLPVGRPGPADGGRRAQPGPGAPARAVRGRGQRRPARPPRPAEPRVGTLLRSGRMSTIVYCHAHPDDEASQTSGAMARASAEGHRVVVVFATNGDHGEIASDAVEGETVAEYRRREAEASAAALGLARIAWLGYADSGMSGWEQNDAEGSFHQADLDEAARRLADVLDEEDADVLVGYDWHGGYGHPDHVKVHHLVHAAAPLARRTPRLLESTFNRTDMQRMVDEARAAGVDMGGDFSDFDPDAPMDDGNPFGTPGGRDHLGGRRVGVPRPQAGLARGAQIPGDRHRAVPGDATRDVRPDLRSGALHRARRRRPDAPRLAL